MITSEPLENEECSREQLCLPVFKGSGVLLLRLEMPMVNRRCYAGSGLDAVRWPGPLSCSSAAMRQSAFPLRAPELLFLSLTGTDAGHAGDGGVNRLQLFPPEPTLSFVKTPPLTLCQALCSVRTISSQRCFRGSVASARFPSRPARPHLSCDAGEVDSKLQESVE